MPGARRTHGLVCKGRKHTSEKPQVSRNQPAFPARWFTTYFVLPGDRALLPPSSVDRSTTLTPASGRQDHTTSPSAWASTRRQSVHRIPQPTSVTIAIRPPEGGTAQRLALIWVAAKRNIFAIRLDGPNQFEAVHEFSFFAHAIFHA
jgi:hypothetical protein